MNDSPKRRACQDQPVPESDSEDSQDWEQAPEFKLRFDRLSQRKFGERFMGRRM